MKPLVNQKAVIPAGTFVTDYKDGLNRGIRLASDEVGTVTSYAGNKVYMTMDNGRKYFTVWDAIKKP